MKLMILILITSLTPLATAATKPIKVEDLNRVSFSFNCANAKTIKQKQLCKKRKSQLKKDLNRVQLETKGFMWG